MSNTVHLKGFASRIDFSKFSKEVDQAVAFLKKYKVVVWDGDLHQDGSFTELLFRLDPDQELVAYRKESGILSFMRCYKPTLPDVGIVPAPNSLEWDELGLYALKDTGAKTVLTFGGGGTVKKEYDSLNDPTVQWHVVPVTRETKSKTEHASLMDYLANDNVHLLDS